MAARRPLGDFFGGHGAAVMASLRTEGKSAGDAAREFYSTVNAARQGSKAQRAQQPRFAPGTDPENVPKADRSVRFGRPKV